jgi:beta-galactosidase beta subunit
MKGKENAELHIRVLAAMDTSFYAEGLVGKRIRVVSGMVLIFFIADMYHVSYPH